MVCVRFAPSPTGYLHLGNARVAIFNYLFARHNGGKLILRIEDTDRERSTKEFEESIVEDLRWLGIDWDEFYRQSERFDIYREYAERLLREGRAYECFCTPEDLEREREEAEKKGIPYRYSGKCRDLSNEERKRLKEKGVSYTVRLRVPPNRDVSFKDRLRGFVSINTDDFGDFIIVRSDGSPTYNFVVVIDDALMGVTHVIRGEDHLSNTPKQILIYEAFGFSIPEFIHLPVILGEDRSKLSKRHGAVSVRNYREEGYVPEALFNYLATLGWNPSEEREIFTKEELIRMFNIDDISKAPAVFNREKLKWMSGIYIREVLDIDTLYRYALPFIKEAGFDLTDEDYVKRVLEKTKDSFETFAEMTERLNPLLKKEINMSEEALNLLRTEESRVVIEAFLEKMGDNINSQDVKRIAKEIQKEKGIKPKIIWQTLRACITGKLEGVGVDIIADLLPPEIWKERLQKGLMYVSSSK